MRTIFFLISVMFSLTAFSQVTITVPGDAEKNITIEGDLIGEMVRSDAGVDKKSEKYYYELSEESLTIWKHVHLLVEDKIETLRITNIPLNDIDWAYLDSSFPDGSKTKKTAGKEYYSLSINTTRGKRFKQESYSINNGLANVTVGSVDINIMDKTSLNAFYVALKAAKK
jgi:hypothetical protein